MKCAFFECTKNPKTMLLETTDTIAKSPHSMLMLLLHPYHAGKSCSKFG